MKRLFSLLLVAVLALTSVAPLSGANEAVSRNSGGEKAGKVEVSEESKGFMDAADVETVTEAVQQSSMLVQLKRKLLEAQYRYYMLQENVEQAKEGLEEIRETIANLEEVIANLDALIKDTQKKILSVKSQKERKKMELEDLEEEVQILELQLEDQKELVGDLMALIYLKRGVYYDEEGINAMKVLASGDSVSTTLQKITYLDLIEEENQSQIRKMIELSEELASKWDDIRAKQAELEGLDSKLAAELTQYEEERAAQREMLSEMQAEEALFEIMIGSADDKEDSLLKEIKIYEENVRLMEAKAAGTYGLLSEDQQDLIQRIEEDMSEKFSTDAASDFLNLSWPVSPSRGLTAFYHDSGYQATFGVQHYALDIRANQGTEIYAPADGVVSEVIYDSESTGYAYVKIAHQKGVMTVFGHVSAVGVETGDFVSRGQIIGMTGGVPGSIGAGVRTTGPHLHFEVLQDGLRVDPLLYLPLEEVPADYLPEEYLNDIQNKLEQELRDLQEQLGL